MDATSSAAARWAIFPSGAMGRIWGAAGIRTEFTAYKKYPWVESDLWNVHGLNNKISLFTDSRVAWSNVKLNNIAVQDDLDDNTYEYVRRYLALTSFTGGILPMPYDPRHLILRQTLSPITGTTDVQASIDTVQLGIHQRLQTKRGPIGKRRIVDYMTLDASTTYFPYSQRDNFGHAVGPGDVQLAVVHRRPDEHRLGRLVRLFQAGRQHAAQQQHDDGIQPQRPEYHHLGHLDQPGRRGPICYFGYSIIDTGPIKTSAANVSISYWLIPKWYGTYSTSYDFGDAILAGNDVLIHADRGRLLDHDRAVGRPAATATLTRSPFRSFRGWAACGRGRGSGTGQFDTRFAPTQ